MLTRLARERIYLILFLLAVSGVLLYVFLHDDFLYQLLFRLRESWAERAELREQILTLGILAPLLFVLLQVLQVLLSPLPGQFIGGLGGYLFGVWTGLLFSLIGLTIGSALAFGVGRLLDDVVVARFHGSKVYRQFNKLVNKGDFVIPFILFIFPGFPKDSLSYLLGCSAMPFRVFIFISLIGRIPGTLMLSLVGAEVLEGDFWAMALLVLISAAIFLPCYLFRKRLLDRLGKPKPRKIDATLNAVDHSFSGNDNG